MHDTNQTHLFSESRRDFSHGCVRLHRPDDLAVYVLNHLKGWNKEKIQATMFGEERKYVKLPDPIEVYVYYMTAFYADEKDAFRFCRDIYGHDASVLNILQKKKPLKLQLASNI